MEASSYIFLAHLWSHIPISNARQLSPVHASARLMHVNGYYLSGLLLRNKL
jgi:hypothetical protein